MKQTPVFPTKNPVPLKQIRVRDPFWDKYTKLVPDAILPYQYQVLCDQLPDVPKSHCVENFRIAAGLSEGSFHGWVFQDSDLAKWLEAVALCLNWHHDPQLEQTADALIHLVGQAQQENGYLNTYFTILHPGSQYCNLKEGHELYTAGHFIEAAVAYYEATGKKELLDIMCRCADHILEVFSREDYADAVPGHEEIELALVKLSKVTGNAKYANMALSFIDRRGCSDYLSTEHTLPRFVDVWHDRNPYHTPYGQAHAPVRQQFTAEGHAVRALYLYSAMADLALMYQDTELLHACKALYENITDRRMYITGGVGSSGTLERFTTDYDLPNDTAYAESCASIALAMFCRRMTLLTGDGKYMDTAETALINTVLAGIAMDGKSFFYVNPLEVNPAFCMEATDKHHVKPTRQGWFGCACCPPNIARTLASLGQYAYSCDERNLWVDLYIGGGCEFVLNGKTICLRVDSYLPYEGRVLLNLTAQQDMDGRILLRQPGYAENLRLQVNGEFLCPSPEKGYLPVILQGRDTTIELRFDMPPKLIFANPQLRSCAGKCAVKKGPLVYCLEQTDNGDNLCGLVLDAAKPLTECFDTSVLEGTTVITAQGWRTDSSPGPLYSPSPPEKTPTTLRFVPYCHWGNRQKGEMAVWVRYTM